MKVYFDYNAFITYIKSQSKPNISKCNDLLKHNCDVYFSFNIEDINKEKKCIRKGFDLWKWNMTGDNNKHEIEYGQEKNFSRPLNPDTFINQLNKEDLHSAFFLDDENIDKIKEQGKCLIGGGKDVIELLMNLYVDNRETKIFNARDMKDDWSLLGEYASPCTDIIIVDRYLFAQDEATIEKNVYLIIKQLCKWAKTPQKPNIILMCNFKYKVKEGDKNRYYTVNIKKITRDIKAIFDNNEISVNITFVDLNDEEHDRFILTNYKGYISGDSFHYFVGHEKKSKARYLSVISFYDEDNRSICDETIEDLQKIIDKRNIGLASGIQGDKESNLLDFNKKQT